MPFPIQFIHPDIQSRPVHASLATSHRHFLHPHRAQILGNSGNQGSIWNFNLSNRGVTGTTSPRIHRCPSKSVSSYKPSVVSPFSFLLSSFLLYVYIPRRSIILFHHPTPPTQLGFVWTRPPNDFNVQLPTSIATPSRPRSTYHDQHLQIHNKPPFFAPVSPHIA